MARLNTQIFIERAKLKHGEHYDYSNSIYVTAKTKIELRCKTHDKIFKVDPFAHFDHHSCNICANKQSASKQRFTNDIFINKAKEIHGNKYDYSKVEYITARIKVCLSCPKHGDFWVTPYAHTGRKTGCKKCSSILRGLKTTKTTSKFIEQCQVIHNNKYNYFKVDYKCDKCKIIITCPKHGDFEQSPTHHIQGKGCLKCAIESVQKFNAENPIGWTAKNWKKAAETSKNFTGFKVYVIKCWNENEEFYKIGRTFNTLERRFREKGGFPYKFEPVKIIEGEANYIHNLETELKNKNKQYKYIPKLFFEGMYECFTHVNLENDTL